MQPFILESRVYGKSQDINKQSFVIEHLILIESEKENSALEFY